MGTTAEKLKYLNETKAEIKNALETPYNVMRDYPELIKKYIDNQPTKVVSDGICSNAVDLPVKAVGIDGNSYQETTEGYNLLNVPAEYTILSTEAYKKVPISLKANHTYTIKIGQINTDNTDVTSVLFRFTYNEVDISNSYAHVKLSDLKTVYTPASDVDDIWIYSGDSYAQGAKTNTTYKNLMIYEGTEDKPYEPYTGRRPSPNPDYPSKIKSIGESWNILNKNAAAIGTGAIKTVLDTGIRVTQTVGGSYKYIAMLLGKSEMLGKTYTLLIDMNKSANNEAFVNFYYGNTSSATVKNTGFNSLTTGKITMKIPDTFPDNCDSIYILLYSNRNGTGNAGDYADYTNLQIYEGTENKPYRDYGNNIFVKQSGKNLFDELYYSNKILYKKENRYFAAVEMPDSFKTKFYGNGFLKGTDKDLVFGFSNSNLSISNRILSNHVLNKNVEYDFTNADKVYFVIGNGNEINIDIDIDTIFNNYNIMVTTTEVTSYEPYHEPIITPINLQGNILSKVGDVKDILRVNRNGEVEIKKNTGKIVLDGSEKLIDNKSTSIRTYWGIDFSNYGIYQYNDPTKVCDILTTKFKSRPQQGTFLPGQVALITSNKNMYFVFEPDTTEEQARAILKDMPVYFRLATPQIITLPSITPIELWQGTNIFKLITNLDTDFEVEYVVDKDSVTKEEE